MNPLWADILRYLAFGQGFLVIVITSFIVARYSFKLSILKARDQALPWHIFLIGLSYIGAIFLCIASLREHLGEGWTWRIPACLFIFAVGDAAFIFMLLHLSVQRLIVAAVIDKMSAQVLKDLEQLKKTATLAAQKAEAAAKTGQQTHEAVAEVKKILKDGHSGA